MPTEEDQQKQQPGTEVKQQDHNQSQSTAAATVVPPTASNQDHRQDQESKPRASETPQDVAAEHEQKSDPLCKVKRESVEAAEESEQDDEEDKKQGSVAVKTELATVKEESKPDDVALSLKVEPKKSVPSPTSQDGSAVSVAPSGGDPPVDEDEEDDEEDDDETGDHEDQDEQQRRRQVQGSKQQHQQQHQKPPQSRSGAGYGHDEEANQHDVVHRQDQAQTPTGGQYYEDDEEDDEDEGEEPSELRQLFEPINDSQALSEDEEDGDYIPDEEVKKTIMVGSDFQAVIPEGLCRYDDALPYENEDKLLWNPTILNEQEIEDYLVKITGPPGGVGGPAGQPKGPAGGGGGGQTPGGGVTPGSGAGDPQSNSVYAIPLGNHLRDDEQSLYLLQQCGHNIDEALRRRRISNNAVPVPEQQMSIWSEEECRNFENGLRVHGKDFHMIQQTKVRTRSVGELVQFYYLWKKTERHDLFASKARLEKKKYNLHPGLTDHMDRFLEEQENSTGFGDRSSSPGFNSLYSSASEAKRQRLLDSKENNTTASSKRSASNL